jgi:hypothetical protein
MISLVLRYVQNGGILKKKAHGYIAGHVVCRRRAGPKGDEECSSRWYCVSMVGGEPVQVSYTLSIGVTNPNILVVCIVRWSPLLMAPLLIVLW